MLALTTGARSRLDGFRVREGYGAGTGTDADGANLYLAEPDIVIANCRILDGYCVRNGAGLYADSFADGLQLEKLADADWIATARQLVSGIELSEEVIGRG